MSDTAMMEVAELVSGYGRIGVLRGASFAVVRGECLGILGHNGMGKTTLLRTIMGLLACQSGRIRFEGRAIERLATHQRARLGLGYVPQGRQIFPALTVRENLLFGGIAKSGGAKSGADDILARILGDFPELKRLLDRPGGALSGGEQQLLALARALCGKPRLLLLDEPTEGIQPSIIAAMSERLHDLRARYGLSILLVEQNLDFIRGLANRALLIHRGQIGREIPPAALADPTLVEEFIAAV
jgi:branched-chain amino acid transport system ATP-binding protein